MDPNQKKVTKEDYLRKKGLLPPEPLGTMFYFKSDRNFGGEPFVTEIKEILIWKIHEGYSWSTSPDKKTVVLHYTFKEAPYNGFIRADEVVNEHRACGSGFGDLWSWSSFISLNKEELEKSRQKEILNIAKKYGVNSNQGKIEFPVG